MKNNPHGGDAGAIASRFGITPVPKIRCDFSVNVNPLGPPPEVQRAMLKGTSLVESYPEAYAETAEAALAEAHAVPADRIIIGNGSTEIFSWILQAFAPQRVSLIAPCYAGYGEACSAAGVQFTTDAQLAPDNQFSVDAEMLEMLKGELTFIGTPNNPTGSLVNPKLILDAAAMHPDRIYVIDEAFIDFCDNADALTLIKEDTPQNVIVVKSLTKFFCIPGLRLGMAYASPSTVARINGVRMPWTVNALAQLLACCLYGNRDYLARTRRTTAELRANMAASLSSLPGVEIYDSSANFVLMRLPDNCPIKHLQAELLKRGILIRACDNYEGLGESFCRIAVRPEHEVRVLAEESSRILGGKTAIRTHTLQKPAIMVVGTTSNAGKSIVAAALCRFFARRGLSVAPFKAQNMALNSFVTEGGGEMGRAQVVQAEAAGIAPHTDMNPVLLKPLGEDGSQVIVNGEAIGNYRAREYYAMKSEMRNAAHSAYARLAKKHELIILEGAGSPAEINLLEEDFVNMDMADHANAATILVADIDRGGVFASIVGTVNLIPHKFRSLLKGIIINKFRGDPSLLDDGIKDVEAMTGIPVLGVLPYIREIGIDDEDSQDLEKRAGTDNAILDIAVVRLKTISNFTDFNALERTSHVNVRFVEDPARLNHPDLIVIPGSKNVREDLKFLVESGWSSALLGAAQKEVPVFGICGGYQMLGASVDDPDGVEGQPGAEEGLALLPVKTVMRKDKHLAQVSGTVTGLPFASDGTAFHGYEIHAGETSIHDGSCAPLNVMTRNDAETDIKSGCISDSGLVFGCYIHGLFDSHDIRRQLLEWLCRRKGVTPPADMLSQQEADPYDRVADMLEKHINMDLLSQMAGMID